MLLTLGIASGQQPKPAAPYVPPILPFEEAWQIPLPAPPAAGGAFDRDRIYVPLSTDHIVAFDRETGAPAWDIEIETSVPPLVVGSRVIIAASDELHAIDAATGERRWRVPFPRGTNVPMMQVGDLIVALMLPDEIWAIRATDGARVWRQPLGGTGRLLQFTADESGIYVSGDRNRVIAVSLRGEVRWEQHLPETLSTPSVSQGRVFVGSTTNAFFALNAKDGSLAWTWKAGGDVIGAGVDGNTAYFASLDNLLRAVNRSSGNQRWKQILSTRPISPPRAAAGVVLVTGLSPTISAFSAKTGAALGTYVLPAPAGTSSAPQLMGEPLVDPDLRPFRVAAAVVTRDGRLIGLRPTGMIFREASVVPFAALPGAALGRERLP